MGTPKVKSIERTLKQISRWVEVDTRIAIWRKEEGGILLEGASWVIGACCVLVVVSVLTHQPLIDAIDNISTKIDLLKYCHDNKIKVLDTTSTYVNFS